MGPRTTRRRKVAVSDDEDEATGPVRLQEGDRTNSTQQPVGEATSANNANPPRSRAFESATPSASPQKSKGKAKGNIKTPPKPAGKPIYSFFNAATQRQQTSQPSTSPDKLSILHEDVELIQDDIDDDQSEKISANTTLSQGSSTALAVRKRKFQRTQSFEDEVAIVPAASQKFRKASGGGKVLSTSVKAEDTRPWTDRFAPIDLSELAVHKRKVADVREWLQATFRGRRQKVLVLKGAAGTGKTTTMQLLAKDLGVQVIEWKDSSVSDYGSDEFVSATARFDEFVSRAGKSSGLTLSSDITRNSAISEQVEESEPSATDRPQALVVEEFPNTFSRTSSALQSFRSTIAQYVSTIVPVGALPTPMVMVISETLLSTNTAAADSFTAHRLLGPELINNPYVNVIEFNPVAPTFLTKALELVVVKEARKSGRRRTPGPQVLKRLAETGDVRSAVSSLEFLCLRGDESNVWSSKVTFTKPKQSKTQPPLTKPEEDALRLITNRESTLGIFHSVGKVVYNKRIDPVSPSHATMPLPAWLSHHRRSKIPETDTDSLLDELGTDTPTFISALHENYALSCSASNTEESLDSLVGCMDNISDSDLLSLDRFSFGTRAFSGSATDTLRQDEMCFQVAVRGILFSLPNPVHRSAASSSGNRGDAHRMFYPTSLKLWKEKAEIEGQLELLINKLANGTSIGTGTRSINSATFGSGVEGWKRNRANTNAVYAASEVDVLAQSSTQVRNEMLLDRLPYVSQILTSTKTNKDTQSLLDQVLAVTRISRAAPIADNDADGDDGEEMTTATEQWSTDQPDKDVQRTPKKSITSGKQKFVFEVMTIPVETRVEKLVLEDDDIVDD